jgi:phosphatidyl-myo-inositol dimannoside synthase
MTVLLISELFPPILGGSARWFWELYRRLPPHSYAVAAGMDPGQEAFDRTHGLPITRVPLSLSDVGLCSRSGLAGYWRALRAVQPIVAQKRVRQVHAARSVPEGWIALLLKRRYGLRYLCYAHGEELKLVTVDRNNGRMSSRQLRLMTRLVLWGAEQVIANSRSTARILEVEWRLPPGRIKILYPGVDTQCLVPAARSPVVRAALGWGDRPVVLTVGRLQRRKGHDVMIRALSSILGAAPDVLYAIAGDGEERATLGTLVAREGLEGHVQFLGRLDDDQLMRCYQQCDLFVLPNRQDGRDIEGFGIVLLEAQACGRPVVAGASGGTAETMRVPETGRIVPCETSDRLAQVVRELLSDRAQLDSMGLAARRWVVERFDWERISPQAEHLFANVAAAAAS